MITPSLSVVVPTHQRRESVLRLLRALHGQSLPRHEFEVVVVVDGSDDGTNEAVETHDAPFRVRHVRQPQRGRAAARNAGAHVAAGDTLLFLDDDMEPSETLVSAHLARHTRQSSIGVVGAVPIVVPADAAPVVRYRASGFARKLQRLADAGGILPCTDVYAGNFSVPRALFVSAGGYDETFRLYGHEDYELALRLERAGVRFVFDAAAVAHQHYTKTLRALAADIVSEGSTAALFALKHPEVLSSLPLGGYAGRSRRTRMRLSAAATLGRVYPALPARLAVRLERRERRTLPADHEGLFPHYARTFELLYWIGAERALHELGAPWHSVAIRHVSRWIAAASDRGDRTAQATETASS